MQKTSEQIADALRIENNLPAGEPSVAVCARAVIGPDGKPQFGSLMGVVVHGATAGAPRPSGFTSVTWIGSVAPSNMIVGDIWEEV